MHDFLFETDENRCPYCNGGAVEVQVIHLYPNGVDVQAGIEEVDCVFCDASGKIYG